MIRHRAAPLPRFRDLVGGLVLALASVAFAGPVLAAEDEAAKPSRDGTVVVPLQGSFELRPARSLLGASDVSLHEAAMSLRAALRAPEPNIVLDCSTGFAPTLCAAEELAAVVRENKKTKRVSILLDEADDAALVLAAACDEVVMPEAGLLMVDGVSLESYYFADALARIGVRFHAVASGESKTAPEALTRSGPSEAGARQLRELADAMDAALVAMSTREDLTPAALQAARDRAPQTSAAALESKLVRTLAEPGAWLAAQPEPRRRWRDQRKSVPDLTSIAGLMQLWGEMLQGSREERHPKTVAVLELAGQIVDGNDSDPGLNIAPGDTCRLIDRLRDDARVVAVVVRIDSPGGGAGPSDRIHHALARLAAVKPVVALFDSVAASGGYYIGCAAREVLTHRATITGSIGVFAVVPDVSGTLDALGIRRHVVTTSARGDVFGLGAWDEDKRKAIAAVVADVDARFQAVVAKARRLDPAKVAELAGGRVYTGEQAIALGLCDGLGTLASAVARARELAGEPDPLPLERHPRDGGLLARLGLSGTRLGPLPSRLRLWADAAARPAPTVMAWSHVSP